MAFPFDEALRRLESASDAGRLAHAYLICGPQGAGKRRLVDTLSARLLATPVEALAKHPDFHLAEPESKSRRILIEQMRRMEHALRERATMGSRKVAVICDADRMQPQAANAFLKTLEEPPAGSHLFLTSSLPGALLDTIVSRCLPIHLIAPPDVAPSELAIALTGELERLFESKCLPETAGLQFAREFLNVLGREREAIREAYMDDFKAEQSHYKQSTDGKWLEEREEQLKAAAEAAALQKRAELLQIVQAYFARKLREVAPATLSPDAKHRSQAWLRCSDALDALAADLQRGVQEALAVESGFLNLFAQRPTTR